MKTPEINDAPKPRQITKFPELTGKAVADVEISVARDFYAITFRFHDKTGITFNVEPAVAVFASYSDWTTEEERELKRWEPIKSILPKA